MLLPVACALPSFGTHLIQHIQESHQQVSETHTNKSFIILQIQNIKPK